MKKRVAAVFIAVMFLLTALPLSAAAENLTADGFTYEVLSDGTVTIKDYSGKEADVTVPSAIDGQPVTQLFLFFVTSHETLRSITIPDSVTTIGGDAFSLCESLTRIDVDANNPVYASRDGVLFNKEVTTLMRYPRQKADAAYAIPAGVTAIEKNAFTDCVNLTTMAIPTGVTKIGCNAFGDCLGLTSVTVPEGMTTIDNSTFAGCTNLVSVTLPDSLTSIYDNAFLECTSLASITIPKNVTTLGWGVFESCMHLTAITIPASVEAIYEAPFYNCPSLQRIDVEADNANFLSRDGVLYDKDVTKLIQYPAAKEGTAYVIPGSVTQIADAAFAFCPSLTSVTIPESVSKIGHSAFLACTALTSLTLPQGLRTIESSTFSCCPALTSIVIPSRVSRIGSNAFSNCPALTSIVIPSRVSRIEAFAFGDCPALTISGRAGSYAQEYASENHIPFQSIALPDSAVAGDANNDGAADTADAVLVLQYAAGLIGYTEFDIELAEVTSDHTVDTADAVLILQFAAGLIDGFPREG